MSPASRPAAALSVVCRAALALVLASAVAWGQESAFGGLTLHHTVPRAGSMLTLVIQGGLPGEAVWLELFEPTAGPPSLLAYVIDEPPRRGVDKAYTVIGQNELGTLWHADERGLVVLNVELADAADADKPIHLRARTDAALSEHLRLHVHAPQLVIEAGGALQRIELASGRRLDPAIIGRGGLAGLSLSPDGIEGYLLRSSGWLEVRSAAHWNRQRRLPISVDAATDGMASSTSGGPAFLLARPAGVPFAAGGRVTFLDGSTATLSLGPMGQEVAGRRWALTEDGLTAFVAEDDLAVREVDVLGHDARGVFVAGLVGDAAITDMLLQGRTLVVATRRLPGRSGGTLTWFDLDAGTLTLQHLDVTPRRLVALPSSGGLDGRRGLPGDLLVVPEDGRFVQRVLAGVPQPPLAAGPLAEDGSAPLWVDATSVSRGALLLHREADGSSALDLLGPDGILRRLARSVPAATTLVSDGGDVALLIGDPSGAIHRFDLATGIVTPIEGIATRPEAAFVILD